MCAYVCVSVIVSVFYLDTHAHIFICAYNKIIVVKLNLLIERRDLFTNTFK